MTRRPSSTPRGVEALWAGLRLCVVDVETTHSRTHGTKIVAIGVVNARSGRVHGRWDSLVNPGVPISVHATRIHGLRDEDVETARSFTDIAGTLMEAFTQQPGERLIMVAHNAAFDIPVIRAELQAAGRTMPDLPIIDTMGPLKRLAELPTASNKLADLLEALDIRNDNPHDALADANATALAVCKLLERVAERGLLDIERVLTELEATTTQTQSAARIGLSEPDRVIAPTLTDTHLATHAKPLGKTPAARTLQRWTEALIECGTLRCSHAAARVSEAAAPAADLVQAVNGAVHALAAAQDGPGLATVLAAAAPVLERVGEGTGPRVHRRLALELFDEWHTLLAPFTRCADDMCPACRETEPCGFDTWLTHLARSALHPWSENAIWSFIPYTGIQVRTGKSVWRTWVEDGRQPIADTAAWLAYEWWMDNNQTEAAAAVAGLAWEIGAVHPRLVEAHLSAVAGGGRPADLTAAIAIADSALATTPQAGPPEYWRSLRARRTLLAGQLARGTARPSLVMDADGNPLPVRRHHPVNARRTRPPRFLRTQ